MKKLAMIFAVVGLFNNGAEAAGMSCTGFYRSPTNQVTVIELKDGLNDLGDGNFDSNATFNMDYPDPTQRYSVRVRGFAVQEGAAKKIDFNSILIWDRLKSTRAYVIEPQKNVSVTHEDVETHEEISLKCDFSPN